MVSLQDFSSLPLPGEVSICEQNGRLCTLPVSQINFAYDQPVYSQTLKGKASILIVNCLHFTA